ncbi:MAG: ABC transporter permease, partial [Bacteroidaceae bacterium]|nr:ABC transporter permease [Bacteroidaceae bacterium]
MKKADTDDEFISGTITNLMASDFKLYNLELIEGRTWNDSIDRFEKYNLFINESAKEALGITDIRIDQIQTKDRLWWSAYADCSGNPPFNIVGVLKDYRTNHLSKGVEPTIYMYSEQGAEYINPGTPFIIHYAAGKQQEVINFLSNLRNEISGEGDLEYSFLEDEIAKRYENDRRIVNIYLIFAGLAIAVSCLGLFGLSLFEIRLRYREIALRKVHGAKMSDIVRLVSKRYLWLLVASAFISIPLSIWFIHRYMEDYAYRTSLSIWIFLLAGAIVAAISAGVLFWQVHKAANINPADVVKSE